MAFTLNTFTEVDKADNARFVNTALSRPLYGIYKLFVSTTGIPKSPRTLLPNSSSFVFDENSTNGALYTKETVTGDSIYYVADWRKAADFTLTYFEQDNTKWV